MAAREDMGTNIDSSFVARVAAGVKYIVTGVGPQNWFGPMQPLPPQAQQQVEGRAFDFPVGYNLRIQPRSEEAVSFAQLRQLADGYDLMRLVLETRKDQIEAYEWEIIPKDKDVKPETRKEDIRAVTDFLDRPDREHYWPQWLRTQIEDMLVLDAICVYPRPDRGGRLYGLEIVAPDNIKRVLDDSGRTPLPPSPAYQQVLKGIPAADYTTDTLMYLMRNPRSNRVYGYSPVEQVITTVNIAIRRQMSQLQFYTEGNVPEAIAQVPDTWTGKQIAEFQLQWDAMNEGNTAQRRKMRFIPSLKDIVFPKDAVLKDEYDEWLARIVCFAFSISPSALIKQVNRASGEQMSDTAKEEGLIPLLRFLEVHMTGLLQRHEKGKGLRFKFKIVNKVSPQEQAVIDASDIAAKIRTPDEARTDRGLEPMPEAEREKHFPAGPDPLELAAAQAKARAGMPPGKPGGNEPPAAGKEPPVVKFEQGDIFVTVHGDRAAVQRMPSK